MNNKQLNPEEYYKAAKKRSIEIYHIIKALPKEELENGDVIALIREKQKLKKMMLFVKENFVFDEERIEREKDLTDINPNVEDAIIDESLN